MTAYTQRIRIIELLTENLKSGLNSKVFYIKELYRFPERLRELRKRDNWVFAKIKEPFAGHNFVRYWIARSPDGKINNIENIPKYAELWGQDGRLKLWELKEIHGVKEPVRWEYVGNNAIAIYA